MLSNPSEKNINVRKMFNNNALFVVRQDILMPSEE